MGEVWQATDEVLGRAVAVKLMLGHGTDPSAADRFRLEAQTAARLSHPHVVGVFDFGTWDGKLFLVMELVEGDSLAGNPGTPLVLPAERVAHVAAHAAAGLAAAHREGVVHRDIKPGNLLLDGDGTVKLADFGIARFVDDPSAGLTTTGQIVGTGLYLAPERALGRPASPASDVYSLGCVLYQLLTGRPPFQGDTATALLYQHIDTPPAPPRQLGVGLPAAFEAYLLTLLAKEPEQRPPPRRSRTGSPRAPGAVTLSRIPSPSSATLSRTSTPSRASTSTPSSATSRAGTSSPATRRRSRSRGPGLRPPSPLRDDRRAGTRAVSPPSPGAAPGRPPPWPAA